METNVKPGKRKSNLLAGRFFDRHIINRKFTIRGHEITRIETLSDAVFAFTISLLVMALEVPQTFEELKQILRSFLPFVATVGLVFLFWYQQYRFFRHYGLNTGYIITLNAVLLVLVLFYVYPLKFLFSLLFGMITHINFFSNATAKGQTVLTNEDFPQLVMIYSIGYAAIWFIFYLMYKAAWRSKSTLQLNAYEIAATKKEIRGALIDVLIGIAACFFAWLGYPALGGICFILIIPALLLNNVYTNRKIVTSNKLRVVV